uniref:F-box domain-containing protein n=1 Tax=Panagrolaimus sp. JU765 TaxID=591449 RepID=A0AC34PYB1_9BILA
MIADEIVHNSIPEDRIQFATTCKAFNQLVKHAKPMKIIRRLRIHCDTTGVTVYINSGNGRFMTLPELKKILLQYQVEDLLLYAMGRFSNILYSELMDLLMEPCRFLTAFSITSYDSRFKYVDFYKKLRHLKSLTIYDLTKIIMDLPYFPPKLELRSEYSLPLLAEKTMNHPLSFLKINGDVPLTDIQQFLMVSYFHILFIH